MSLLSFEKRYLPCYQLFLFCLLWLSRDQSYRLYVLLTLNKLSTNMAYTSFVVTHLSMPSWIYVQLFCFNICMAWFWFKWLLSPYLILWPGIWNYLWLEVCSYVPDIVLVGGPSGSGKTSLAHKMANIVGCEVVSLERYYKSEQVKDFKYDDFSSLDLSLLSKVRIWYSKLFLLLYFYILLDSKFKRYE